jgi:hypothetical protein
MTMSVRESTGECRLCGTETDPSSMAKHLAGCIEEYRYEVGREEDRDAPGYHIAFQSKRAPMYWVHILCRADASLGHVDAFLRDLWMEGRDKKSRFYVGTKIFGSTPSRPSSPADIERDMSIPLDEVLEDDVPLEYAYDLDSATELEGRVIDRVHVLPDQKETPVRLLARNEPPEIPCACGNPADYLCPTHASGPDGWLCVDCVDEHGCFDSREEYSKIRNTPRAIVQV